MRRRRHRHAFPKVGRARPMARAAIRAGAIDAGSVRLLRLPHGRSSGSADGGADRAAHDGAGDGAAGGLLFDGCAAGGQGQGGGDGGGQNECSGHGASLQKAKLEREGRIAVPAFCFSSDYAHRHNLEQTKTASLVRCTATRRSTGSFCVTEYSIRQFDYVGCAGFRPQAVTHLKNT